MISLDAIPRAYSRSGYRERHSCDHLLPSHIDRGHASAIRHMSHHDECRVTSSPRIVVWLEDRLNWEAEQPDNLERQWQTGIIFAGFERVGSLARDIQTFGKVSLRPIPFSAQQAQ